MPVKNRTTRFRLYYRMSSLCHYQWEQTISIDLSIGRMRDLPGIGGGGDVGLRGSRYSQLERAVGTPCPRGLRVSRKQRLVP